MAINDYPSVATGTASQSRAQRRAFMLVQGAKSGVGGALGVAFFGVVGRPDPLEWIALAGLIAPAGLALLGLTAIPLAALEQAGLAGLAVLIGYLAILTGGVTSPLVVWFALVPAEAALVGGRSAVMRAVFAAAAAVLAVAAVEALGLLPQSRIPLPVWEIYACS